MTGRHGDPVPITEFDRRISVSTDRTDNRPVQVHIRPDTNGGAIWSMTPNEARTLSEKLSEYLAQNPEA